MSHRICGITENLSPIRVTFDVSITMRLKRWLPIALVSFCNLTGCVNSEPWRQALMLKPTRPFRSTSAATTAANASPDLEKLETKASAKELPGTSHSAITLTSSESDSTSADRSDQDDLRLPVSPNPGTSPSSDSQLLIQMSLADLEYLALQNNPTLSQAQAQVSSQQGQLLQDGLYPNPQIGYLNGSATKASVKQSNGVFASQEIVTARKLQLAQLASSEELKKFQWDYEAQRMRVMNDLKIRYYEVLGAQEAVLVNRELLGIAEKTLHATEQLLANQATRQDFLQAKFQLETARLSLEDAEYRYETAWEQLSAMIGISTMKPVPLDGSLSSDIPELDLEYCWQQLLERSPQIKSTEAEIGHGVATLREAYALAIPNVTVQSVVEYDRATDATTASTLVALPLPIHNRNQGNIQKAAADLMADRADMCRVQLVLRDQLAESFRRYKASRRQAERLRDSILPNSEENMQLAQQLFGQGQTAFAPVQAAQQQYFRNKIAYVESLTELHKVATEIQGLQLTGGLNPAAIGSAIQNMPGGGAGRQRALLNDMQDRASKQLLPAAQIGQ